MARTGYYKGVRYQRRQLPRRLASVAAALLLWGFIGWWAVGTQQHLEWLGIGTRRPWLPSLVFATAAPLIWFRGNRIVDRALRTVPRLLYSMHVDHWKLLVVDIVSWPIARFTTVAMTVVVLNLALQHAPKGAQITLPKLFYADVTDSAEDAAGTFELDASAVADVLCPLSRKALRALAVSTLAWVGFILRSPPSSDGSRSFRLVPLRRRGDTPAVCVRAPDGMEASPSLLLFSEGRAVAMPQPVKGKGDCLPVWTFAEPLIIDEYTWETPRAGFPEADPVEWRLEAQRGDNVDFRWHGIHETDTSLAEDVPVERGALLRRRYIAPKGEVPAGTRGFLGRYYRALQHPHEDRNRCALASLVQSLVAVPLLLLGALPWLTVLGVELSSIVGMTSVGGMAAGAALSLAKSEVLENLFAGALLSAQGLLLHGDDVEIRYQVGNSMSSLSGVVVSLGSAYLTMHDDEGQLLQMPNRRVLGSVIYYRRAAEALARQQARGLGSTYLNYLSRST